MPEPPKAPHPPSGHDDSDVAPIVARAQRGEVEAFNLLVERFQRVAFAVALRMVGNREVAADLTQEAIIAAYRALSRFRGGSFRVWLLRIVTNQCLDYWRSQQRRPTLSLDALVTPGEDANADAAPHDALLTASAWDPAQFAERRELQEAIQRGLLMLPTDQRMTVVLSDVEGLSYDEIAAVTQANIGTVKSRLARGRARLRDYLRLQPELLPRPYRLDPQEGRPPPGASPRHNRSQES